MNTILANRLEMMAQSAKVVRYHTRALTRAQSVGEHTYGVMWLLQILTDFQCGPRLLYAALVHDAPEYVTGDIPAPVKLASPALTAALHEMEDRVFADARVPCPILTSEEARLLRTADCLEGALYCLEELHRGNRGIQEVLGSYLRYLSELGLTGAAAEITDHIERKYLELYSE